MPQSDRDQWGARRTLPDKEPTVQRLSSAVKHRMSGRYFEKRILDFALTVCGVHARRVRSQIRAVSPLWRSQEIIRRNRKL